MSIRNVHYAHGLSSHVVKPLLASAFLRMSPRTRWPVPEPVQPLRRIGSARYDAIAQFGDRLLLDACARAISPGRGRIRIPVDEGVPPADRARIDAIAASVEIDGEVIQWPIAPGRIPVEVRADALRLHVSPVSFSVTEGADARARIGLVATAVLETIETDESHARRVDVRSFRNAPPPFRGRVPAGSGPIRHDVELGVIETTVDCGIETLVDDLRFTAQPHAVFERAALHHTRDEVGIEFLVEALSAMIHGWARQPVSPSLRLFGGDLRSDVGAFSMFDVDTIGIPSNQGGTALALCVRLSDSGLPPEWSRVRPFMATGNFAFYATAAVMRAASRHAWNTFSARRYETSMAMHVLQSDGSRLDAECRVEYVLDRAATVELSYGNEDVADNIALTADVARRAVSACYDGRDITDQLGELASTSVRRELFRLLPDRSPVSQPIEAVDAWLRQIGRHVLLPLIRPVGEPWRIDGDYETQVSAPISAMVTRGELR